MTAKDQCNAMGCISSTTYNGENAPQRNLKPIPRQPRKPVNEVTKGKGIPIVNIYHH